MLAKRGYERPEVKQVKLKAEEAVLSNCKTPFGGDTNPGPCHVFDDPGGWFPTLQPGS